MAVAQRAVDAVGNACASGEPVPQGRPPPRVTGALTSEVESVERYLDG
jgi:hypothetical protein